MTAILEAKSLRVLRGSKLVLRDVDLTLRAGEVLGVLGPSGAGKSTLFRALVGEVPLADGTVHFLGEDITRKPLWVRARAGIGYVPQTPSVLLDLTVGENLATFQRIALGEVASVDDAARRVDLGDKLRVRAGDLSAGERRRLELARAITPMRHDGDAKAGGPKALICDEPFAGVDPAGAARLGELLRGLAKEHDVAVVLADHHVPEALHVCDVASLLLDGGIALTGSPDTFKESELVRTRYLAPFA